MAGSSSTQDKGVSIVSGIGAGIVFCIATTNCIVYARGTSSSGETTTVTGVSPGCATLMLLINVVMAIIAFIAMIYFFYKGFFSKSERQKLANDLAKSIGYQRTAQERVQDNGQ